MNPGAAFDEDRTGYLFQKALELPAEDRHAFLEANSGGDLNLVRDVLDLLEVDTEEKVGRYRIGRELGRGGMGVVHLAYRDDDFKQEVALKRFQGEIALGTELVEQFRTERQILATLQHPSIVQLLDGGSTNMGRPYLVMQYVDGGIHLDTYCQRERPPLRKRVELFLRICDAVKYAHQKTVIHRDLKPNNILITPDGEVKLLDFGLGRMLSAAQSGPLNRRPLALEGQDGTPGYGSPEQLRGLPSDDVRTDVYALGAILYELLSGAKANPVGKLNKEEYLRKISEQDPPPPSEAARLSAAAMAESPEKLSHMLRGDLDTIVRKAMARKVEDRYSSVEKLISGLRCWVEYRPIPERRHAVLYVAGRFIRRRRAWVTMGAAAMLAVTLGLAVFVRQQREVTRADERAERSLAQVRHLAHTLLEDVHGALEGLPGSAAARRMLLERAGTALENLAKDARADRSLRTEDIAALGNAYIRTGDLLRRHPDAETIDAMAALRKYQSAIQLLGAGPGPTLRPLLAKAHERVAETEFDLHAGNEKVRVPMEAAHALIDADSSPEARFVLSLLARLESAMDTSEGRTGEARQALLRAIAMQAEVARTKPSREVAWELAESRDLLAESSVRDRWPPPAGSGLSWTILSPLSQKEFRAAIASQRESIAQLEPERRVDPRNYEVARRLAGSYKRLGGLYLQLGDTPHAVESLRTALELYQNVEALNPASPSVQEGLAKTQSDLAEALMSIDGKIAEAANHAAGAVQKFHRLGRASREGGNAFRILGNLQYRQNQSKEALQSFQEAVKIHGPLVRSSPGNLGLRASLMLDYRDLAFIQDELDQGDASLDSYNKAVDAGSQLQADQRPDLELRVAVASVRNDRGNVLSRGGREVEKSSLELEQAKALLESVCPDENGPARCRQELGTSYLLLARVNRRVPGEGERVTRYFQKALAAFERIQREDPENRDFKTKLAEGYTVYAQALSGGDRPGAEALYRKAAAIFSQLKDLDPVMRSSLGYVHALLADCYENDKNGELARKHYSECISTLSFARATSTDMEMAGSCYLQRGSQELSQKRWTPAAADLSKAISMVHPSLRARAHYQMARAQEGDGHLQEALASVDAGLELIKTGALREELQKLGTGLREKLKSER